MTAVLSDTAAAECLINAGLPQDEVGLWLAQKPPAPSEFSQDCKTFSDYWLMSKRLLGRLTQKPRTEREEMAARALQDEARAQRVRFLRQHVDEVYDALTARRSRFIRVEDLAVRAATVVPGLVPTVQEIAAEDGLPQKDKTGLEIDQGLFVGAVLSPPPSGRHLPHSLLLPREA